MFARRKGKTAEQELARLLRDSLGDITQVERNPFQSRMGGYDLILSGLPVAVEVKRVESPSWLAWFRQAREQAGKLLPVIAHRGNHEPWTFTLPKLTGAEFCHLVRALHHYRAAGFPGLGNSGAPLQIEGSNAAE